MSQFQFLASDQPLGEVSNPYLELLSVNEAIQRKMELADVILNNPALDKEEKVILVCDSEKHLDEIQIQKDTYYSEEYCKEYSSKKHFSELQWRFSEERAKQLIDYIADHLQHADDIEIWSIWLDDHKKAKTRTIDLKNLKADDLLFLATYVSAESLIVRK